MTNKTKLRQAATIAVSLCILFGQAPLAEAINKDPAAEASYARRRAVRISGPVDMDQDGVPKASDCDDLNPSVYEIRYAHTDANQDGYQENYYGGYNEGYQCTGAIKTVNGRRYAWGVDRSCFRNKEGYYFLLDQPLGYDTRSC